MKWLWLPLLWLAATIVAVAVLYRLWRGHNVVLKGRWSPRFVRMVVIVLVVLGFGVERATAAPVPNRGAVDNPVAGPTDAKWPTTLTAEVVGSWLVNQQPNGLWATFKKDFIRLSLAGREVNKEEIARFAAVGKALPAPVGFQKLLFDDLKAQAEGKEPAPLPPAEARKLAEALEAGALYDHWASAYLWRRAATSGNSDDAHALTGFHAQLHRHACLTNTLIQAQAQVKPLAINPRAWMGKAGPPGGYRELQAEAAKSAAAMVTAAAELYPKSDSGTWSKDGLVVLALPRSGSGVTLVRAGFKQEIKPGATFRLGRLDVIEVPAGKPVVVEHAWLGPIELPADRLFSSRALAELLPEDAKVKVKLAVAEALKGAEDPTTRLEKAIPLAHPALRAALSQDTTDLPGAPRLRLILSLFDDAVMPALVPVELPKTLKGRLADELDRDIAPHRR